MSGLKTASLVLGCWLSALPATALAQDRNSNEAERPTIDRSAPTYTSLTDGQPNDPGELEFTALGGVSVGDRELQTTMEFTPKGPFWSNALFTATFPTVNAGGNVASSEVSATLSWQQRWFGTNSSPVDFSTSAALQFPVNEPNQSTDFIGTAALNVLLGSGVGFLNGFVETQSGSRNPAPTDYGAIVGYKQPLNEKVGVIGDVLYARGSNVQLEGSAYFNATDALTIGPGFFLQTQLDNATSDVTFGAGVTVSYAL